MPNVVHDQIFSGSKNYTFKKSRELYKRGWVLVDSKRWSDGKYTLTMRYEGNR